MWRNRNGARSHQSPSGHRYLAVGTLLVAVLIVLATALVTAIAHRPGPANPPVITRQTKPATPASTAPIGPISENHTVNVDGVARTYRSIVPGRMTGPVPLLIVLHGRGQTAVATVQDTGFRGLAEQRRAVLVYPDGVHRSWDAGHGCCGYASTSRVQDVAFLTAIVADAVHRWPVDTGRVYLVGYSNGGKLAYTTVCAHPTLFAAVATYGAAPLAPCEPGTPPVPYLLAAGTADRVLPFQGKPAGHPPLPAVPQAVAWLRAQDGCPDTAQHSQDGSAVIQRWVRCLAGTEVESVVYSGRGHAWPTAGGSPALATLMWAFLSRHGAHAP